MTQRNTYTKECGCRCQDWNNEVDVPRMFWYYSRGTGVVSYCEQHKREAQESMRQQEDADLSYDQYCEAQARGLVEHKQYLRSIQSKTKVPLEEAAQKRKPWSSSRASPTMFIRDYNNVLEASKKNKRRYCSKERLAAIDFTKWERMSKSDFDYSRFKQKMSIQG